MEGVIQRLLENQTLAKLVGETSVFQRAIAQLPTIAKSDAPVLVHGETGTGKELVARAVHYLSARAAFPFVPVNCGSLSESLIEDELFGHERGAFTDAHARRQGILTLADHGTLFLDEVDTLPAKAQVGLLRFLQDRKFRAIGCSTERESNVRVVVATNAQLPKLVADRDLQVGLVLPTIRFRVFLPPLRERKDDVLVLAAHFLKAHAVPEKASRMLSPAACAALMSWDWPGNVRELENAIIRGIHLSSSDLIAPQDLGLSAEREASSNGNTTGAGDLRSFKRLKQQAIDVFEKDYLINLLSEHGGNVTRAARAAGKERRGFGKLLEEARTRFRGASCFGSGPKLTRFRALLHPSFNSFILN